MTNNEIVTAVMKEVVKVDLHHLPVVFYDNDYGFSTTTTWKTLGTTIPTEINGYLVSNWDGVIEFDGIGLVKLNVYLNGIKNAADGDLSDVARRLVRREYRHLKQIEFININKLNAVKILTSEFTDYPVLNNDAKNYENGIIIPIEDCFK